MDKKSEEYVKMAKAYHDKVAEEYDKPEPNEVLGYDELYNYITDKIECTRDVSEGMFKVAREKIRRQDFENRITLNRETSTR